MQIGIGIASAYFLTQVSKGAFTQVVRAEIINRDRCCTECGSTDYLHAAHYNHDKRDPKYNSPENGRALCIEHHLEDHIENAGENGLSKHHNDWAISSLRGRLKQIRSQQIESRKLSRSEAREAKANIKHYVLYQQK